MFPFPTASSLHPDQLALTLLFIDPSSFSVRSKSRIRAEPVAKEAKEAKVSNTFLGIFLRLKVSRVETETF